MVHDPHMKEEALASKDHLNTCMLKGEKGTKWREGKPHSIGYLSERKVVRL